MHNHRRHRPERRRGIQAGSQTFGARLRRFVIALVAQNTRGVRSVYRIEPDFVAAQLDLFSAMCARFTKIDASGNRYRHEAVAERLARYQIKNVVPGYRHAGEKRRSAAQPGGGDVVPALRRRCLADYPEPAKCAAPRMRRMPERKRRCWRVAERCGTMRERIEQRPSLM